MFFDHAFFIPFWELFFLILVVLVGSEDLLNRPWPFRMIAFTRAPARFSTNHVFSLKNRCSKKTCFLVTFGPPKTSNKNSPRAWVVIGPFVFCSENVPENHQVLKSEVPGLQKSSPGLQKRYRKHQKDVLGSPIKRSIIQLIPSILRLAYYGLAECAKR